MPGVNVAPVGSAPDSDTVGAGNPVAVTVKLPGVPTVKVVVVALVIAGGWFTFNVKFCAGVDPATFVAVNVIA